MQLIYPDLPFDDQMIFERGKRTIVVQWMGRGNTEGDAMVWLPEEKVLVTGDVLVAPIPYAFDSPMIDWIETLRRIKVLKAKTIVPGHGAVQHDEAYLDQVIALLEDTVEAVANAKAAGVEYAGLAEAIDLSEQEQLFTAGDPHAGYAWRSYYLGPALLSAWVSLGYPVPEGE